jgi:hypothetical protein
MGSSAVPEGVDPSMNPTRAAACRLGRLRVGIWVLTMALPVALPGPAEACSSRTPPKNSVHRAARTSGPRVRLTTLRSRKPAPGQTSPTRASQRLARRVLADSGQIPPNPPTTQPSQPPRRIAAEVARDCRPSACPPGTTTSPTSASHVSAPSQAIPEPSTVVLAVGLLGVVASARRFRRR